MKGGDKMIGIKPLSETAMDRRTFERAFSEALKKGLSRREALEYAKIQVAINQNLRKTYLKRR